MEQVSDREEQIALCTFKPGLKIRTKCGEGEKGASHACVEWFCVAKRARRMLTVQFCVVDARPQLWACRDKLDNLIDLSA
jgi:hypothetical protein